MAKVGRLIRTPSLSSDSNSGKINKKGYPFYLDSVMNATIPSWFIDCTREEAEKLLKSVHPNQNVVLMRPSTKAGCWALSVETIIAGNTEFNHYSVVKGAQGFLIDIDKKHRPMSTLSEVIDQFVKMASKETRKYMLYDPNAKQVSQTLPNGKKQSNSVREAPAHRKEDKLLPHNRIPLPATPGPPPAAPRPPVGKFASPPAQNIVSSTDYVPIEADPTDSYLVLTDTEGYGVGQPSSAINEDGYLSVYEDDRYLRQRCTPNVDDDYLTMLSDEHENSAVPTQQLQGLNVYDSDINDGYLVMSADYEPAVNKLTSEEFNNNESKMQSNGKQLVPPPIAPRPFSRSK